jgi:short-chain fatty acids transporter
MLNRLASFFVRIVERWMPDPFLFCLLLTAACYLLALGFTSTGPLTLVTHWYGGLWEILPFAMQMILILLTGYALASSGPVRRVLERIASVPRSQGSAIVVLTVAACLAALIHWGFALVASALLALVAGAYSGFVIWGSGLSSSIALVSATEGSAMNFIARYTDIKVVGLSDTLFSPMNLALVAGTLVALPVMFRLMMPRGEQLRRVDPTLLADAEKETGPTSSPAEPPTPAQRLERSRLVLGVVMLLGAVFLVWHFATRGFALDLNVVILLFLVLGMALHGTPAAYLKAFNQAGGAAGAAVPTLRRHYGDDAGLGPGGGDIRRVRFFFEPGDVSVFLFRLGGAD